MADNETEDSNEKRKRAYNETANWKAKFELGEIPILDPAFNSEEHLRMVYARVQSLEKSVKTLDTTVSCLICVLVIVLASIFIFVF